MSPWRPGAGRKPIDPAGKRAVKQSYTLREDQAKWLEATAIRAGVSKSLLLRRLLDLCQEGHFNTVPVVEEREG